MNSNNTTRTIWHNNWASELKSSGSTQPEEPWKGLRALEGLKGPAGGKALGVWWPGVCKDCRLVVLGLGSRPRAAADVGGPLLGPYNSDRSFGSAEHLSFYDIIWLDELRSPNYRQGHHWLGHKGGMQSLLKLPVRWDQHRCRTFVALTSADWEQNIPYSLGQGHRLHFQGEILRLIFAK